MGDRRRQAHTLRFVRVSMREDAVNPWKGDLLPKSGKNLKARQPCLLKFTSPAAVFLKSFLTKDDKNHVA